MKFKKCNKKCRYPLREGGWEVRKDGIGKERKGKGEGEEREREREREREKRQK